MTSQTKNLEIQRVKRASRAEFVSNWLRPHKPVIITDAMNDWRAIDTWSLDYLAEQHADHSVLVEHYPTGSRNNIYTYIEMTVRQYVDTIRSDPSNSKSYYLADTTLESTLPNSIGDVGHPEFIPDANSTRTGLFVGRDTFSAAHYHRKRSQALLCQIVGVKELLLYPARDTGYLYPHPWYGMRPNFSQIDMEFSNWKGSFKNYPRLDMATSYYCKLNPGESLFIPDHWMHAVAGPDDNVSLTYFWDEPLSDCHKSGVFRDYAAQISKSTMLAAGRMGKLFGLHQPMLNLAVRLGIVPEDEREAVLQHFEEFGGLPGTVKSGTEKSGKAN